MSLSALATTLYAKHTPQLLLFSSVSGFPSFSHLKGNGEHVILNYFSKLSNYIRNGLHWNYFPKTSHL